MQMIAAIVSAPDVTAEKVAIAKELIIMRREMEADEAKKLFAKSFIAMRKDMPQIQALKEVEGRYKFAPFEDIRRIADPVLTRHGFAVCFDTKVEENRMISICTLMHEAGHSVSNQFACRFSKPPGTNDSQGDMATRSYAMRGAFCDAIGIVIDKDTDGTDGRGLGKKISKEQADALADRASVFGPTRVAALLRFAEAESFEEIYEGALNRTDRELTRWENAAKKKEPAAAPGARRCDQEGNLI